MADGFEQPELVDGFLVEAALFFDCTLRFDDLFWRHGGATSGSGESDEVAGALVEHATETFRGADRPREGSGGERQLLLDVVENLEGHQGWAIPLVDEREDRNLTIAAHLEQFERLWLDAFCGVEHHDGGVGCGEHTVGVFGEVAVTRGVEQVDYVVAVRELQHGRGDRDATLLFELHPVRRRRAAALLAFDRTGLGSESAAVEQELLGERGLASIGMRNDRKRPAAFRLFQYLL